MDDAIDALVLAPFRELVSLGTVAIGNAETAADELMLKAAQELVKEGKRALKNVEPLCQKHFEESGLNFINALKDNEEISRFIEDLNNLLYDFEDYIEADSFEAEKVAELRGLSKRAAPRICHIINHMRLEHAHTDLDVGAIASSAAVEPPTAVAAHAQDDSQPRNANVPYPDDDDIDFQVKYAMSFISDRGHENDDPPASSLRLQQYRNSRQEDISPASPSTPNPWLSTAQEGLELVSQLNDAAVRRGSAVAYEPDQNQVLPTNQAFRVTPAQPAMPVHSSNRASVNSIPNNTLSLPSEPNRHWVRDSTSPIIPRITSWDSAASSANASTRSSVSNYRHERSPYAYAASPISTGRRASAYSTDENDPSPHVAPLDIRPSPASHADPNDEAMEPVVLPPPSLSIYDGLIPVEEVTEEPVSPLTSSVPRLGGCTITLNSSYSQFKGFCRGAMEALHGGVGIRHIKKQSLTTANMEVAKCKDCAYELEWEAVRRDINCEASENLTSTGIGFRLRFLSKSHMPTKDVGEQTYGCLFCVRLRRTTHPNDATVFFSQQQLFAHLARHARPLPDVPGLTVVEGVGGQEVGGGGGGGAAVPLPPPLAAHNYDLHLPNPARVSHLVTMARDLAALPTATATQTVRTTPRPARAASARSARSSLPDHHQAQAQADVLSFAAGAKIVGVEFPPKYQGQWCVGWADHVCGAIPVEAIQLDPPRKSDAMPKRGSAGGGGGGGGASASASNSNGGSNMKAVARWRCSLKDKDKEKPWGGEWLSFGKGEVITNIGWSYPDHWCWWGTNSKGKSGMFPQVFIEPGTLRMEAEPARDRPGSTASASAGTSTSTSTSTERRPGIFSRISLRNRGASS